MQQIFSVEWDFSNINTYLFNTSIHFVTVESNKREYTSVTKTIIKCYISFKKKRTWKNHLNLSYVSFHNFAMQLILIYIQKHSDILTVNTP